LALLVVPVLLTWRFVRLAAPPKEVLDSDDVTTTETTDSDAAAPIASSTLRVAVGCTALAVVLFTAAIGWSPVGGRHEGRVMFVERHSTWEPTTRAYDPSWYGEASGYNYAAIYDYLGQYYTMSRLLEKEKIDDDSLAKCDVLIVKIPTARYTQAEVDAVARFVERGGGLLLIGDHTNLDRSTSTMNDITRRMGFIFRDDLLFGFNDSPYDEHFAPSAVPHPILQHMPPMDFAVSCSIDPGNSHGRAVILNTGLWSMGPEYHHENYHPVPQHCPEMRYGAFVQAWAARYGQGRAVAFGDSTVFSNFCTFQPGKAEVMLGIVEWLNRGNALFDPRPWLLILGLPAAIAALWLLRRRGETWLILLAGGACAWAITSVAVAGLNRWTMPMPPCVHPQRRVVIDRTVSNVPLSKGADTQGDGKGYGLLEQWIARLRCYTIREEGAAAFSGDMLVVICPNRPVPEDFRKRLIQYVSNGGKLIVMDSPENTASTANSLLWPFGLAIHHDRAWKGQLSTTAELPVVDVQDANEVVGGQSLGKLDQLTVVAATRYEKGFVMAIGLSSLWNDKRMGEHWMLNPDTATKARYDVLFGLLRPFFDGQIKPASSKKKPLEELPFKESGPANL
jgi:hypothetical protein